MHSFKLIKSEIHTQKLSSGIVLKFLYFDYGKQTAFKQNTFILLDHNLIRAVHCRDRVHASNWSSQIPIRSTDIETKVQDEVKCNGICVRRQPDNIE